ncbi:putative inactive carboxylesterase 4 isoform X2 [Bacillus rossius redtenbacheri]|uniref:putative inactive carboxylesterase 4 isoform X2 n=1 Tax=Bacillus rossius redtenbacheri TaxID=93214 RepID=UPI002FDE63AE
MNIKNFIIFLLIVTFFKTVCSQDPSVQLHHGTTILGVQVFTESRVKVHAFLGVPYAQPPTGKFRFSPPHKWVDWNQTIIASRYAPSCPQLVDKNSMFEFNQDEDCLYLNIWVPQGRSYGDTLPTIVFLEGENFVTGSPSKYPAQDLAAYGHGVIVISISYRLNIFGFFCLEDSAARGNLGLLDQYFALLWVREHIQSFGGSKTSITLMGHSTGAASVVLHMTSSRTIGLFQRAIVMSGSATSPWSVGEHPANCSMAVSRSLNCLLQQTVDTLRCLQAKSAAEILAAFQKQCDGGLGRAALLPVVDSFLPLADQYLTRHPRDALHSGDYRPVPVLSGIASLDGSLVLDEKEDLATQSYQELQRFFSESAVPAIVEKYGFINHIQVIQDILKWRYVEKAKAGDVTSLLSSMLEEHCMDQNWFTCLDHHTQST